MHPSDLDVEILSVEIVLMLRDLGIPAADSQDIARRIAKLAIGYAEIAIKNHKVIEKWNQAT